MHEAQECLQVGRILHTLGASEWALHYHLFCLCPDQAARSLTSADVADLAQWAQQKKRPPTSTPWPITLHRQCSQIGAIAWIAHSKLSNVCR